LVSSADHDDRVVPLHSFKYIAALQHEFGKKNTQKNPLLIRIEVKAGHSGSSLTKEIEYRTDFYAFISICLNAKWTK